MENMSSKTFSVVIEADPDGDFVVSNPSLPGCYSQGETVDEALANIKEATLLYLEELEATGQSAPEPQAVSLHTITA